MANRRLSCAMQPRSMDALSGSMSAVPSRKICTSLISIARLALLVLLPCLVVIAAVCGYFLSSRAMRPMHRLTKAAVDIGIGNLSARLPLPLARDELCSLTNSWNQLLDRLEGAVTRLSKFSADASHDLRTSITVILATAQVSLNPRRSDKEVRDNLGRIVNECRTASTLLDALLSLARSTNFVHEVAFQRINAGDLVAAACLRVEGLGESSGLLMDWTLPKKDLFIEGDELLLKRLLGILLDNAIKFTPESGEIAVEAHETQSGVFVIIRDTGIGISEDIRRNNFDRFYQANLRDRKDRLEVDWDWRSLDGSRTRIVPNSLWRARQRKVQSFRFGFQPRYCGTPIRPYRLNIQSGHPKFQHLWNPSH
jgi:two-component system heavy metal sensor histidine kinase CusS